MFENLFTDQPTVKKKTGGMFDGLFDDDPKPTAAPIAKPQSVWRNVPKATDWTKAQPMSIKPAAQQPKQNILQKSVSGITKLGSKATDFIIDRAQANNQMFSDLFKEDNDRNLYLAKLQGKKLSPQGEKIVAEYGNKQIEFTKNLAMGMTEPLNNIGKSLVSKYLKNAYKVYDKQKPFEVVAKISDDIAAKTDLPKDIVVKQSFFEKVAESHPELEKNKLFNFVKTLNIPDEVYSYPKEKKLGFFRNLQNETINVVSTGKDWELPQSNVVTSFEVNPAKKYVPNLKKQGTPVFQKDFGTTPQVRPSNIAKSEVPELGGDFSALQKPSGLNINQGNKLVNGLDKKTATGAGKLSEVVGATKTLVKDNRTKQGLSTQSLAKAKEPLLNLKASQKGLGISLKVFPTNSKPISINSLQKDITSLKNSQVNTTKLNISDEGKNLINKTVEEIKPKIQKYTGKVLTNKEALEAAEKSSDIIEKAAGRDATLQWESAMVNARKKMAFAAENGRVDKDFIDGLVAIKTQGTDIARKLQSFSIKANPEDKTSMQAIIEAVLDTTDNVDEVLKAAQGVDFTDLIQATQFYRKFVKPTASEWIDLLRYNSMLSSPLTHIVNIFSNLMNTATVKPIEKALAGGFDFLGSAITGKERAMFAGESGAYMQGYFKNVKDATKRLSDVMQGKRIYTNLDVRQIPVAVKGVKGAAATTLSFPLRLLEGMDQFFTALAEGGEKAALDLRASKGVKTGNIATQAQEKAAYSIYRQGLFNEGQGITLDMIDQFTRVVMSLRNNKNPAVSTIAKFTSPFVQTPMNIFKQGVEYSPLGFTTIPGAANKTEQLTKAVMGSAVFAGAATLLASNRISGEEPIDAKTKAEYRAAGKQPYSVKIGKNWVSFQKLSPVVAFPFAMVSVLDDVQKQKKADDNTVDLILSSISKYTEFLANQSYVKNIGDALAAAQGEEYAMSRMISNYPQQLIPFRALSGWITRLADDTQRVADNKAGFVEQQIQWLMTNMPGLSQKVPARMDAQGNPVKNTNSVFNAFSPMKMTTEDIEKAKDFEAALDFKRWKQENAADKEKEKSRVQPIYDRVQQLKKENKLDEAYGIVNGLTNADYEIYKDIKSADKTKNTEALKEKILPIYLKVQDLKKENRIGEAQVIVNGLTEEEYRIYKLLKAADK